MIQLTSRLALLFVLTATLAACNLAGNADLPTPDDANVIYVTATPNPAVNVDLAQTAPPPAARATNIAPTNTVPPTPSLDPRVLLQLGDRYHTNGYYAQAAQTYEQALTHSGAPAELRAEAAFKAGQSAVREGLFQRGVDALTTLIEQYPNSERLGQAYFLRGDAYLGVSNWSAALADFQQYVTLRPGVADSYAYERLGDAQLALGQTEAALNAYTQAIDAGRVLVPQLILREKLAQIYSNLGRYADAVAQYDAILSVARNSSYRGDIEIMAAEAMLNNAPDDALTRYRRIFSEYPGTSAAYSALLALEERGVVLGSLERGRVLYNNNRYADAIEAFETYTSTHQLAAIPADLYLMLGRAYREIGNDNAALTAFQTILDSYPQDPAFGEALLEQGRTHFLAGDNPTAIETYLRVADNYGYLADTAAEALWRAGYLLGTDGERVRSREVFTRLADNYPDDEWTTNGLFIAASAAVNNNEPLVAENLYGRIATLTTGEDQAAAYLWVGRLAQQRGDQRAADEAFNLAVNASPDSYFAARASDIRQGITPFQPAAGGARFDFDVNAEVAEAENWLRTTYGIQQQGALWPLSDTLKNDPLLVRGSELWAVAAYDDAYTEFSALLEQERNEGDALASYQLAVYFRSIGAYPSSIVAAADVIRAANVATVDAPGYIARMRYPAYYLDLIERFGGERDLDPLLMLGLMRQESLFNPNATSFANARGLAQVIPSTGQYIADQLNKPGYNDTDLYRPYVSVEFGTFYLAEQLRLFDGFVPAALAAYNGGPGNALDWYAIAGRDLDLLVTTITFSETRSYVQRIYGHYNIYRTLYRQG